MKKIRKWEGKLARFIEIIYFTGKCLKIMQDFAEKRECGLHMLRRPLNPLMFLLINWRA